MVDHGYPVKEASSPLLLATDHRQNLSFQDEQSRRKAIDARIYDSLASQVKDVLRRCSLVPADPTEPLLLDLKETDIDIVAYHCNNLFAEYSNNQMKRINCTRFIKERVFTFVAPACRAHMAQQISTVWVDRFMCYYDVPPSTDEDQDAVEEVRSEFNAWLPWSREMRTIVSAFRRSFQAYSAIRLCEVIAASASDSSTTVGIQDRCFLNLEHYRFYRFRITLLLRETRLSVQPSVSCLECIPSFAGKVLEHYRSKTITFDYSQCNDNQLSSVLSSEDLRNLDRRTIQSEDFFARKELRTRINSILWYFSGVYSPLDVFVALCERYLTFHFEKNARRLIIAIQDVILRSYLTVEQTICTAATFSETMRRNDYTFCMATAVQHQDTIKDHLARLEIYFVPTRMVVYDLSASDRPPIMASAAAHGFVD